MNEVRDAPHSCMEQLLLVREEKERLIIEASTKISSEQKKAHDLQQKLEDANKRFLKVATENYSLRDTVDSKDKLIKELNESKAHLDQKLTEKTARLEFTQKQCSSLQYEVRILQKELEIRNKEREYDLRSIDAAQKQHKESIKKIATLEAECQRLRTMVQKRLPGPAALAKMKDEVEQRGTASTQNGMRKPRIAVQPSLRAVTQRHSVSEGYLVKLQELNDENTHLRQLLAKKKSELQSMHLQYADEACKLSAVQKQPKELSGDHDSEESDHSKPWANSLMSNSEHFKVTKHRASQIQKRRIAGSDMQLLVNLVEIEKLEIASRPSSAPHQCEPDASDTVFETGLSEASLQHITPDDALSDQYPEWIKDVLKLIIHKHQVSKISGDVILDEVTLALSNATSVKGINAINLSYDRSEIDIMAATLIERVGCIIERSTKNNAMGSQSFLQEKSEVTSQLEHLLHVCSDALDGKASLGKFIDEICLILEWIVNRYFSCLDGLGIVYNFTNNSDGNESLRALRVHEEHAMQSAKSEAVLGVRQEAHKELTETNDDHMLDEMLENHSQTIQFSICQKLDEEMLSVRQEQGDNCQEKQSTHYEAECTSAKGCTDKLLDGKGMQLLTNSAIFAAAEKLAECQETITSLSKQLQALRSPANTDALDKEKFDGLPLSAADVLPSEDVTPEESNSPTSEEVKCKKEHGEPVATEKNIAHEKVAIAGAGHKANNNDSTQVVTRPVIPKSPRPSVSIDMKKKRRASLLSRLIFRKKT